MSDPKSEIDPEHHLEAEAHLRNTTVNNISFSGVTVTVKDRETKAPRIIVDNAEGIVNAGEICALMGPSGCGKTTLLNVLTRRPTNASAVEANILVNGKKLLTSEFGEIASFVEQEDSFIGALTVMETLEFSSRLSSGSFGLTDQANTLIGTPLRKGISGGQKRRVGIASQLITNPPTALNVLYKYVFHYWDYEKYVFEGMMINEFSQRIYSCGAGCHCMYESPLADQCKITGQAVLDQYGYKPGHGWLQVSIVAGAQDEQRIAFLGSSG